jgi:hypothetical protein
MRDTRAGTAMFEKLARSRDDRRVYSDIGPVAAFCRSDTPMGSTRKTAKRISAGSPRGAVVAFAASRNRDTAQGWNSNRLTKTYQTASTAFHRMAHHIVGA